MIAALRKSKGGLYLAAEKLGVSAKTIRRYLKRWQEAREVLREERGKLLDKAEGKLLTAINKGDAWAVQFALKTIGRKRGYVERTEVTGAKGGAVKVYIAEDGFDPENL